MGEFFSVRESGYIFKILGLGHIIFLLGFLALILHITSISDLKKIKRIKNFSISIILIQQVALYVWYLVSGYFSLVHSLPLYTCRVAMISLIVGEFMDNKTLKSLGIYWGIPGSIIAFIYPVLDPFGSYHFTFYSFFLGHIGLIISCIMILKVEGLTSYYNAKRLKSILVISSVYNIIMIFINNLTRGNYCYISESPIDIGLLTNLKGYEYNIFAVLLFNFVMILSYVLIKKLEDVNFRLSFNQSKGNQI